jgi:hypothetical protein
VVTGNRRGCGLRGDRHRGERDGSDRVIENDLLFDWGHVPVDDWVIGVGCRLLSQKGLRVVTILIARMRRDIGVRVEGSTWVAVVGVTKKRGVEALNQALVVSTYDGEGDDILEVRCGGARRSVDQGHVELGVLAHSLDEGH